LKLPEKGSSSHILDLVPFKQHSWNDVRGTWNRSRLGGDYPLGTLALPSAAAMVKVTFLDYGAGNILSLRNALEKVGCEIQVPHRRPPRSALPDPQAQKASAPSRNATQPATGEDFAFSLHFPDEGFLASPC